MKKTTQRSSLFERLEKGLQEGIRFARGELNLRTAEVPPRPPSMGAREIVHLRRGLKMSQEFFARMLNVSPKTVQSWEQRERTPSQSALRLLQILRAQPGIVCEIVGLHRVPFQES
jgi:putative transcriptional regulator